MTPWCQCFTSVTSFIPCVTTSPSRCPKSKFPTVSSLTSMTPYYPMFFPNNTVLFHVWLRWINTVQCLTAMTTWWQCLTLIIPAIPCMTKIRSCCLKSDFPTVWRTSSELTTFCPMSYSNDIVLWDSWLWYHPTVPFLSSLTPFWPISDLHGTILSHVWLQWQHYMSFLT